MKLTKPVKIILVILAVLIAIFLFIVSPRMFGKPDSSFMDDAVFAHRGYFNNVDIPENSLPSFTAAIEKGFGIELDIQLSKDGVAMVFHDADLERMCGVKGNIWDFTYDELKELTLMGTNEKIPTLEEALALIDGQVPLLVEYKMDKVDTNVCVKGQEQLDKYNGSYAIQAFDPRALMWYKSNAPQVLRGQLSQEYWTIEKYDGDPLYLALANMLTNVATRPDFISYRYSDNNFVMKICDIMGAKTACWTLRSPEDYAMVEGRYDVYIFDSFDISEYKK